MIHKPDRVARSMKELLVGDAVEFVLWLRNLAAHPGRHIRDAAQVHLGEVAYRNAYGVVAAACVSASFSTRRVDTPSRYDVATTLISACSLPAGRLLSGEIREQLGSLDRLPDAQLERSGSAAYRAYARR